VWDAIDESVRRNNKIKLAMTRQDKQAQAWKRVVLGRRSKSDIVKLCGVSDGTVAQMRRVLKAFTRGDKQRELRAKLGEALEDAPWMRVKLVYLGVADEEKISEQERAERLARALRSRMHGKLSENSRITALALRAYDESLPDRLIATWKEEEAARRAEEDKQAQEALEDPDDDPIVPSGGAPMQNAYPGDAEEETL
jgi:hypothetical protein